MTRRWPNWWRRRGELGPRAKQRPVVNLERLQQFARELQARQAARARLPIALAFLMPMMVLSAVFSLTALSIFIFWRLHGTLHQDVPYVAMRGAAAALITFPSFFGSLPPGLMLANWILAHIPFLKRILDENAKGVPDGSYRASMRGLRKAAVFMMPPSVALALLGAIAPWEF